MSSQVAHEKYAVLFIDDEVQSQKYFSKIFGRLFKVHLASDGVEGLEVFRRHIDEIGLVVSDQRMPNMTGSALLAEIAQLKPDVVKILSTAYSDIDAAIDAVNDGGIYRYVTKPWDIPELEVTLRRAMEFYELKVQSRHLSDIKIGGIEQIFLQSRLLAAVAVPALLNHGSAAIRAYRDLLKISLSDEQKPLVREELTSDLFADDRRAEALVVIQKSIEEVLELTEQARQSSAEELEKIVQESLSLKDSETGRPSLSQSFISLIGGASSKEDHQKLASLIALYGMDKQLDWRGQEFKLIPATQSSSNSVVEELCSLFIDDSLLVSSFLNEARN